MAGEGQVDLGTVPGGFLCFGQLVDRPVKQADDTKLVTLFCPIQFSFAGGFGGDGYLLEVRNGLGDGRIWGCSRMALAVILQGRQTVHCKVAVPICTVSVGRSVIESTGLSDLAGAFRVARGPVPRLAAVCGVFVRISSKMVDEHL